jgi:hypothetical protein
MEHTDAPLQGDREGKKAVYHSLQGALCTITATMTMKPGLQHKRCLIHHPSQRWQCSAALLRQTVQLAVG